MDNTEEIIGNADAATAARYAVAAIKRMGQHGRDAGDAFRELAEANAGEPDFEEGMLQIND